jgi:hypothetical protein
MTTLLAKWSWIPVVFLVASCATVVVQQQPTGNSTSIQDWFKKGSVYYTASYEGKWFILAEPQGNDTAEVCQITISNPVDMDVLKEIALGKGRPVGFAINHNGDFVTAQAGRIHVYDERGRPQVSFNATVQDSRLSSPLATDEEDRIYIATLAGLDIFTREGISLRSVPLPGITLSVTVARDQSVWCVTDAHESSHLIHLSAYPECRTLADYDRVAHPIRGMVAGKSNNYTNWREVAVSSGNVLLTRGTGKDTAQCIYVLSQDGGTLVNKIVNMRTDGPTYLLNAHGLSTSGDTLLFLDYDTKMTKWLNRATPVK